MDRLEKLLFGIERTARILEVGPSHNPIAPKAAGWRTCVLDYTTEAALREKYRGHGIAHDRIESVDFVWTGGAVHDAVPADQHGTFDACIASHVLEHMPNPIGLFESLNRLLTADGVVSLAVPDKRFCFDYFRPLTLAPAWIEAFEQKSTRHSRRSVLESGAYHIANGEQVSWGQFEKMQTHLRGDLNHAKRQAEAAGLSDSELYMDCHAWCFTPSSFELLFLELGTLGLIDFRIAKLYPTDGCEFIVSLRKGHDDREADIQPTRLALLKAMIKELSDQDRDMNRWFTTRIMQRAIRKIGRLMKADSKMEPPSK